MTLDTTSSASRQHYIDTGRYLGDGEAIEAGEGGDIELGFDEESTSCAYCGDTDAEAYIFGRQGQRPDGTWGVVETYTRRVCSVCVTHRRLP